MQKLSSIVALNIRQGGGRRTSELIKWLRELNADIVVLSEWCNNLNGLAIEVALTSSGYHIHSQGGHVRSQDGTASNGVLIAAREQFNAVPFTPPDAQAGVLLRAQWTGGLTVVGAYFPLRAPAKKQFFDVCVKCAKQHSDAPFLLIGDLNTGRNQGDLEAGGTPFPRAADFVALCESGLIDQWRQQHQTTEPEYTWRSRQKGFRIDHALANKAFEDRYPHLICSYDHSTRESKLSDHSALILRLASSKAN
jgi:exonuclease III